MVAISHSLLDLDPMDSWIYSLDLDFLAFDQRWRPQNAIVLFIAIVSMHTHI